MKGKIYAQWIISHMTTLYQLLDNLQGVIFKSNQGQIPLRIFRKFVARWHFLIFKFSSFCYDIIFLRNVYINICDFTIWHAKGMQKIIQCRGGPELSPMVPPSIIRKYTLRFEQFMQRAIVSCLNECIILRLYRINYMSRVHRFSYS